MDFDEICGDIYIWLRNIGFNFDEVPFFGRGLRATHLKKLRMDFAEILHTFTHFAKEKVIHFW